MQPSTNPDRVIGLLRQRTVATLAALAKQLHLSRRTVRRALLKHGYFSSCNQNATFVTLRETVNFSPEGLWTYRKACFSAHGTLLETIRALVEASPAGKTVAELEEQLQTRVHNQLSWLLQQKELTRGSWGRHTVYLAHDPVHAAAQQRQRQQEAAVEQIAANSRAAAARRYPEGMNAETVIRVLVQMIDTPKASPASLAKRLRSQDIAVGAQHVRRVIEFYSLEKKTEP